MFFSVLSGESRKEKVRRPGRADYQVVGIFLWVVQEQGRSATPGTVPVFFSKRGSDIFNCDETL